RQDDAAGLLSFRMVHLKNIFFTVAASMLIASLALAEQVPQWEIGAGVAYIDFPHYRGSNERQTYVLPIPYVIYHGDILKVDRQRMRGMLFHTEAVELDVSVNGSVPVRNDVARQGMPDLDPTIEIGPALNISLYKSESNHVETELRLPLRSVFATDFSYLHDIGLIFQPQLNLDVKNVFDQTGWNLGMGAGPIFTDRRYNQYFYGVDDSFARSDRPAYTASGGYAGSQFVVALSKSFPRYWVGGFVKWDRLQGAVFEGSPLVKSKDSATFGFAISRVFTESSIKVDEDN
ncbi:MAG TPA: MipA/OmpV family protein, partial [Gallionellaceae bacterium]|nr:MipA/OmpV family protein [Gallionellaceae bacterium]